MSDPRSWADPIRIVIADALRKRSAGALAQVDVLLQEAQRHQALGELLVSFAAAVSAGQNLDPILVVASAFPHALGFDDGDELDNLRKALGRS